jgi:sulfate transport system ATP-binding protein
VSRFLGSVNLFHGRVHDGWAQIGELRTETPDHTDAAPAPAVAYLRPHEIELSQEPEGAIGAATVNSIRAVGPIVRLELQREGDDGLVEVELSRERYAESNITLGQRVFIRPRQLRVFVETTQAL